MAEPIDLAGLVEWLYAEDLADHPAVEARARLVLLDTLGCTIAALGRPEVARLAAVMARSDPGPVRVPGVPSGLSPTAAAYVAGAAACWDEACEGLARAHGRPGLHAFPAVLSLSLARDRTLGEALAALVAGYEVGGRLGERLRIPAGMHVDGTWGTLGAVVAAARLAGLDAGRTASAVEAAACQLPWSLYLPIPAGATVRNTYVGASAVRAMMQVVATEAGITAPPGAVELYGRLALGNGPDAAPVAPAGEWIIEQGYLKSFAAVRHVHYGAAAALRWRRRHGDPDPIRGLTLAVYPEAVTYCGNRAPRTPMEAQFSLSYGVAWCLARGGLDPDAYAPEGLRDPEVRRLEGLVVLEAAPEPVAGAPRSARLTVETASGTDRVAVDALPGDPGITLSTPDLRAKFVRFAGPVLGTGPADAMAGRVLEGDPGRRLGEVLATGQPPVPPTGTNAQGLDRGGR